MNGLKMKKFLKKYAWLIVIVLTLIIGLVFTFNGPGKLPDNFVLKLKNQDIEVYSKVNIQDIIKETNGEIKNDPLKTTDVGKQSQKIKIKYRNKEYDYEITYNVVDETNPKIFGSGAKTIDINYEDNLCNLVTMADNYDRYLDCKIEGDYDLKTEGSYKIRFVVTDDSGNQANHNLTLNVQKPNDSVTPPATHENLTFADAQKKYLTKDTEMGIDVSKWQGDIDFEAVKEAGATFVMMRIGNKTKIGDEINIDPYFKQNLQKAQDAGLKIGIYFYSKAASQKDAIAEAKWIIKTLKDTKLDLPICFDWENWSSWNTYHLNFNDLNDMAHSFLKTVEEAGYKGMLYGSKFYLENFFTSSYDRIWLAHYTSKTSYEGYDMWQFSNIGSIPGINGDVDLDILKIK